MNRLPIEEQFPAIRDALSASGALVLEAPPGAGKTTLIPLALLDEPWLAGRSILMLEPRRLAARAAALRMAELLGEEVGQTVGYRVRHDSKVSARTRIEVLTEGILTRRLQQDPELAGVGLVIFDEFHERHLHGDLALTFCLDARDGLRDDLKLLVMSATLDGEGVARFLAAPRVTSAGRQYPVEVIAAPVGNEAPLPQSTARIVARALAEQQGDILVFLPGSGEIRRTAERLEADPACEGVALHPLYGDLPYDAQRRALLPDANGRRKVVLATPIAESSLTIEGVSVVVDSGWMRTPRFDPRSGLTRLETVRVSRASAEQRRGRAGRLGPGVCYRLWGETVERGLLPDQPPEIVTADLAPLALELAAWGVHDAATLRWFTPPPEGALAQARALLTDLDALDSAGHITAIGKAMAALPLHPRLAHLLVRAEAMKLQPLACDVAALLSERDLFRGSQRPLELSARVEVLAQFRAGGRGAVRADEVDVAACASVERVSRQLRQSVRCSALDGEASADEVALLLAAAYPDRIGRRRGGQAARYLLSGGRGARLAPGTAAGEFLVAAEIDGRGEDALIRLGESIRETILREGLAGHIAETATVRWDVREHVVVAQREERLGALVLSSRPLAKPGPEAVAAAMTEGVRRMGIDVLPWNPEARALQARILSLRHWFPEEAWPDLSDDALENDLAWLSPYLNGMTRRDHLARLDLKVILLAWLDYQQQRALDADAPTHLAVPSGSRLRLEYRPGEAPVLAVKLQELFGLAETPTVARGRVPVTLHLLSPARRPVQVTNDLKSFWERTYPEVCKELKGRYPKHPWPEDPWNAVATARTKQRR